MVVRTKPMALINLKLQRVSVVLCQARRSTIRY